MDTSLREKESLQRERDQIESLVKERTDNLAQLATHLQNTREDERGDLARAMHDEFGSLLTAAKLDVARLKSQLSSSVPDAEVRFTHLNSTLNNIIMMTRNIVENLRPSSLSHLGLTSSLEILAREFEKQHNLTHRPRLGKRRDQWQFTTHCLPTGARVAHQYQQICKSKKCHR